MVPIVELIEDHLEVRVLNYSTGGCLNLNYCLGTSGAAVKKVEMDGVGDVNGVPLFEYDVDAHDKPWKLPGKIMYNCNFKDTIKCDVYMIIRTLFCCFNIILCVRIICILNN